MCQYSRIQIHAANVSFKSFQIIHAYIEASYRKKLYFVWIVINSAPHPPITLSCGIVVAKGIIMVKVSFWQQSFHNRLPNFHINTRQEVLNVCLRSKRKIIDLLCSSWLYIICNTMDEKYPDTRKPSKLVYHLKSLQSRHFKSCSTVSIFLKETIITTESFPVEMLEVIIIWILPCSWHCVKKKKLNSLTWWLDGQQLPPLCKSNVLIDYRNCDYSKANIDWLEEEVGRVKKPSQHMIGYTCCCVWGQSEKTTEPTVNASSGNKVKNKAFKGLICIFWP